MNLLKLQSHCTLTTNESIDGGFSESHDDHRYGDGPLGPAYNEHPAAIYNCLYFKIIDNNVFSSIALSTCLKPADLFASKSWIVMLKFIYDEHMLATYIILCIFSFVVRGTQCYGVFTVPDTEPMTDKMWGDEDPMRICVGVCPFLLVLVSDSVNTQYTSGIVQPRLHGHGFRHPPFRVPVLSGHDKLNKGF